MTCNWYLDTDGLSHRLHTPYGWSDTVLAEDTRLPVDGAQPLGAVEAADLTRALRDVRAALLATLDLEGRPAPADELAVSIDLTAGHRGDLQLLMVGGKLDSLAISRDVPWQPIRPGIGFRAGAAIDIAALPPVTGTAQLSIGADEQWTATLVLSGQGGPARIPLERERLLTPPFALIQGEARMTAAVARSELSALLDRVPEDQAVTLALVPDRVLVRTDAGVVGALDAETSGTPAHGSYESRALRGALAHLATTARTAHLELFEAEDAPTLRIDQPDRTQRAAILPTGWTYR